MKTTLIFYGVIYIIVGILCIFLLPKQKKDINGSQDAIKVKDLLKAMQIKGTWLICGLVFFWYMAYSTATYAIPYLTDIYNLSPKALSILSVIRAYGLGIVAAPFAGFIGQKMKSPSKALLIFALVGIITIIIYLLTPVNATFVVIPLILTVIFSFAIFAARGIYFSPMAEAGIPLALTGAASGLISILGYSPDMFIFSIMGGWLDKYSKIVAYRYIFILAGASLVVSMLFGFAIYKYGKKIQSTKQQENQEAE